MCPLRYSQIGEFFGPVISDVWALWLGRESTFYASALFSVLTLLVIGRMKETLKEEDRRPFSLTRANPIASIGLPFRLDRGMRRLAVSHFLK